jgi:flagellar hook assembly protein FlgD
MNTKTKMLTLVALMMSAVFSYAASPIKMSVVSDATTGIYKVVYRSAEAGKVKVSILDANKELVFTETLNNVESFSRPYNFSNLSQGEYTIVVEDKNGKTEEKVSYHFVKVQSTIEVAKIGNEQNKYLLSVENKATDLIHVRILDVTGNVLHEQSMTVNGKFSVVYNLNKVKTAPIFEVSGSDGAMKTVNF